MGKWNLFREKKTENKKEIRYILSIDGGGMRGIVPAHLLSKINDILKEDGTDRPLYSYFDLIAGTSTGAILALALTVPSGHTSMQIEKGEPYPVVATRKYKKFFRTYEEEYRVGLIERSIDVSVLESIYKNRGNDIFKTASRNLRKLIGPIFSDKYDPASLEGLLFEAYGDAELKDALVPTLITSFNPLNSKPYLFKSWDSHGYLFREAARASSAAPTYFPPANLLNRSTEEAITLVDGGLALNNPVLAAYSQARQLYPNADEFRVISLSTITISNSFNPVEEGSGAAAWASTLWKSYASGTMELADDVAQHIKDLKYTRVWAPVVKKKIRLDNTTPEAINELTDGAEELFRIKEEEIRAYLADLKANANHSAVRLCYPAIEEAPQPSE